MHTKIFRQLDKKDVAIAGGKGASLGEMTQAGVQVPPGFVVSALAFDNFLAETDLGVEIEAVIRKVNHKDISSVNKASSKIRDLIANVKFPDDLAKEIRQEFKKLKAKYVAVRSSATAEDSLVASWAGELESYLNTTDKKLLDNIKLCWSSLFTPRAIFYRFEQKLDKQKVSVAVVVQKMIQSEISGIVFTVHPVTKDNNQMVIEVGYGLGETIVSGSITPDTYIIDKSDLSIIDINVAKQEKQVVLSKNSNKNLTVPSNKQGVQKMTGSKIIKLAKICIEIEDHYKFPCDIEWGFEKGKFYILQSRPITTL